MQDLWLEGDILVFLQFFKLWVAAKAEKYWVPLGALKTSCCYLKFYFAILWTMEVSLFARTNETEMQGHSPSVFETKHYFSTGRPLYCVIETHCHLQLCRLFIKVLTELLIKTLPNEAISDLIWIGKKIKRIKEY